MVMLINIVIYPLFCLYVTSILWPCLTPLSLPFKSLPLSKFTVCVHACVCVNSHPGSTRDTVGISESRWMLLPSLSVPGPSGPLSSGMGFVNCLYRSQCQDENAWVTVFSCPFLLPSSFLILLRSSGTR